ncbi:MAG TPA: hypothetical protein DHW42_00455 [Candidatus Marinimicrobia bacterium]|nr:hypothetical protein [Candidatus Neomarinimicrobiota bacterium]
MPVRPYFSKKRKRNIYDYWNPELRKIQKCAGFTIDLRNPINGDRVRKVVDTDFKIACDVEKQLSKKLEQGINVTRSMKKDSIHSMSDLYKNYKKYYDAIPNQFAESITESTIKRVDVAVKSIINTVGDINPKDVTEKIIDEYRRSRLEKVKPTTINTDIAHLKVLFNWAIRRNHLDDNPFKNLRKLRVKKEHIRVLSIEEFKKLLAVCGDDIVNMSLVLLYIFTGARRSEILRPKFTWDDIDFTKKVVYLRHRKRDKESEIAVGNALLDVLTKLKEKSKSKFPFPYDGSAVYNRIMALYKKAGIQIKKDGYESLDVHSLRKSTGSFLAYGGTSIYDIKEFLAHSSTATTEKHYLSQSTERMEEAAHLLNMLLLQNDDQSDDQNRANQPEAPSTTRIKVMTKSDDQTVPKQRF